MQYKTGKLAPTYDRRDLLFTEFKNGPLKLSKASVGFGHQALVPSWGMLGNDRLGDCAAAGPCHEHMLWTSLQGKAAPFGDEQAIALYSAVTGYNPADPSTDRGTNVRDMLSYRKSVGITDAIGGNHKIGGYCALEPGNWTQLLEALKIFDVVGIGIEFPQSAMDQFNQSKPWTVVHGAEVEGGHYVPVCARPGTDYVLVVTWGQTQLMGRGFYQKYNDESYGMFSTETLINGKSPEGFSLADFQQALTEI